MLLAALDWNAVVTMGMFVLGGWVLLGGRD